MKKLRYKKPIILFLVYLTILSALFLTLMPPFVGVDLYPLVYGKGAIEWLLIMVVFWPLAAFIGGFFFGFLLIPIFLFIYKKTIGINMIYGIQEVPKSKEFKKSFRGLFPALMAINFSLMLSSNDELIESVVITFNLPSVMVVLLALLIFSIPTIGIAMALFAPVWSLLDAGIMYSNKEKIEKKNKEEALEGRTLGGWYMHVLKGYSGISTIVSYYFLILIFFRWIGRAGEIVSIDRWIQIIISSFVFFPLMFLIAIAAIPTVILLDITKKYRIRYVKKWANRFGIKTNVKIIFQEMN